MHRSIQVRLDLRMNLGHADITLDKALERALHIEAVKRIEEEDNEQWVSAIQSNQNSQLVNLIKFLERKLQTNKSKKPDNQNFNIKERGLKSFMGDVSQVQEKPEIEKGTITAIPEAPLIKEEPIMTVERDRQHQEVGTEAKIGRTRVVLSSRNSGEF